jgi:hypothetical protein
MALGRLAHYAFDAVLISTVLAGVRRSSGFSCVSRLPGHTLPLTDSQDLIRLPYLIPLSAAQLKSFSP